MDREIFEREFADKKPAGCLFDPLKNEYKLDSPENPRRDPVGLALFNSMWKGYLLGLSVNKAQESFEEMAERVIKYLAENHHPHTSVIATATHFEVLEGAKVHQTEKYLKD